MKLPVRVLFAFDPKTYAAALKSVRLTDGDPWPAAPAWCTMFRSAQTAILVLNHQLGVEDKTPEDKLDGLIVHEAEHVRQFIMEMVREKEPSPEFSSYLVQSIFEDAKESYRKFLRNT